MKVCDKCRQEIKTEATKLKIKGKDFELCSSCTMILYEWLGKPLKKQGLGGLFG